MKTINARGQTLVEAIVAIAVAMVIVTAIVTLGIGTQRAANTSRNQNQNTRYGEEALELIRSIRDANLAASIKSTGLTCDPNCKFTDLFSAANFLGVTPIYFTLAYNNVGCSGGTVACWQLTKVASGTGLAISGTIYTRTIKMWDKAGDATDPADKVKFVEATITWTDASGPHNSVTSTKLTNFK